ncbi:MAG TPA: alpha-amylase family glycosyl hydrolase [Chryseolinea sp.]|nr:alpha-amylase family glycosyl hydrolase [Chryseolinea sp.]
MYPSLYQINIRVWLTELSRDLGRKANLDDIPESALDEIAQLGFDWVWLLSVWCTGPLGRSVSCDNADFRREFEETLPDLCEDDIGGSGFAIADYKVHPSLGGDDALKRLRQKLKKRGIKLMLDFVPNHMGPDHRWVRDHPEAFIRGTASELEKHPQNYTLVKHGGDVILAYGRDPYFAGWPDTYQLDYANPALVELMKKELIRIAGQCDGVRCDMAMLILPEIFGNTWGKPAHPFWPEAIKAVREKNPGFVFMAEVYWDMEWTLQQQGFDYAYDKRLYDRLREGEVKSIREHFYAGPDYQDKLARFLENHDEPRIASTLEQQRHEAAAVITFLSPGLRFFHQGQFEGRTKRISPHLIRGPVEPANATIGKFYTKLLAVVKKDVFRSGQWQLLKCGKAWDGNESFDSFVAFAWKTTKGELAVVCINYADHYSQCYVNMPFSQFENKSIQFKDQMSDTVYHRDGNELLSEGLYLDLAPWGYHVFESE